jgi:hypothetical protein
MAKKNGKTKTKAKKSRAKAIDGAGNVLDEHAEPTGERLSPDAAEAAIAKRSLADRAAEDRRRWAAGEPPLDIDDGDDDGDHDDETRVTLSTGGRSVETSLGTLSRLASGETVNPKTGEILADRDNPRAVESLLGELVKRAIGTTVPRTPEEHLRAVRTCYEHVRAARADEEQAKESKKEAKAAEELARMSLETACRPPDPVGTRPLGFDDEPEGAIEKNARLRRAYELLVAARLNLSTCESLLKERKSFADRADTALHRAIRGEWDLPFPKTEAVVA